MSEKLNSYDDFVAGNLRRMHEVFTELDPSANGSHEENARAIAPLIEYYDPNRKYIVTIKDAEKPYLNQEPIEVMPQEEIDKNRRDVELEAKANLWEAHEHKEAHLDEYIETARQEAEAAGQHINLQPPAEQQ